MPGTNWWVHQMAGTPAYIINHNVTEVGETARSPANDDGYSSIPIAEAALRNMTMENGTQWHLHRKYSHASFQKWYQIDRGTPCSEVSRRTCRLDRTLVCRSFIFVA